MDDLHFTPSRPYTIGVELELQLLERGGHDLTPAASDLLSLLEELRGRGEVKREITQSMIEMSTGVHTSHGSLLADLRGTRDALVTAADRLDIRLSGGGAHPFQHWSDRLISDRPRYHAVSALYGYLAKQFTVFGQHVHVGCTTGDDALYLLHAMARHVPHFIALSASSPYYQGVDTAFESSRLNTVLAFPLSGRAPFLLGWDDFVAYVEQLRSAEIVLSMKDFYWDIRPSPAFGTVEIRVFDTPLTVERAAALAAYVQSLARWLLAERPYTLSRDIYLPYSYNRFQACRFGLEGEMVDIGTRTRCRIGDDVLATIDTLTGRSIDAGEREVLRSIADLVRDGNDARWMREQYGVSKSFARLMERQAEKFREA